jgi:hypothetical protein
MSELLGAFVDLVVTVFAFIGWVAVYYGVPR